jgi:GAF domain-containing protein
MKPEIKAAIYQSTIDDITATLDGETDLIVQMATIACLLNARFEHINWVGFYRVVAPRELAVGPYQGNLGCLRIPFHDGVCGACASSESTVIVEDTHLFHGHIPCDPRSRSEIVVPVFDQQRNLIAVLDVDSTELCAFDTSDQLYLERIAEGLANGFRVSQAS